MKNRIACRSKFTESQIIKDLKENEQGRKTDNICREMGIHKGTFYNCAIQQ